MCCNVKEGFILPELTDKKKWRNYRPRLVRYLNGSWLSYFNGILTFMEMKQIGCADFVWSDSQVQLKRMLSIRVAN